MKFADIGCKVFVGLTVIQSLENFLLMKIFENILKAC